MVYYDPEHHCWAGAHYKGPYLCPKCQRPARLVKAHTGTVIGLKHYEVHCDACGAHAFLRDVADYVAYIERVLG